MSIRQPACEMDVSLPIRKRSTTLWPTAAAGRFTVLVENAPEVVPVQAWRPASGLLKLLLIVPL